MAEKKEGKVVFASDNKTIISQLMNEILNVIEKIYYNIKKE